jgi:hypothetical protein
MDLPSHPDADDADTDISTQRSGGRRRTTGTMIALWALGAVVVVVIVLHLTGVVGPLGN